MRYLWLLGALPLALLISGCGFVLGNDDARKPPETPAPIVKAGDTYITNYNVSQAAKPDNGTTVTLTGEAKRNVEPDQAVVELSLSVYGNSTQDARERLDSAEDVLRERMAYDGAGNFRIRDCTESGSWEYCDYEVDAGPGTDMSQIFDDANSSNASVLIEYMELSDSAWKAAEMDLIKEALQDARGKAVALLNRTDARLVSYEEQDNHQNFQYNYFYGVTDPQRLMAEYKKAGIDVQYEVKATFQVPGEVVG